VEHACINLRHFCARGHYVWEFNDGGQQINVRVTSGLACNDIAMMRHSSRPVGTRQSARRERVPERKGWKAVARAGRFGDHGSRATICTTQAEDSLRPHSLWSSTRCDPGFKATKTELLVGETPFRRRGTLSNRRVQILDKSRSRVPCTGQVTAALAIAIAWSTRSVSNSSES
jgi:hypothetical protein